MQALYSLFERWAQEPLSSIEHLPPSGSDRRYFRLRGKTKQCIATEHHHASENEIFLYLSKHFRTKNLPVPEIYAVSPNDGLYLQEDLGHTTLLQHWEQARQQGANFETVEPLYRQALKQLARLQTQGAESLDFQRLEAGDFDAQVMQFDLNYFYYYFLKPLKIEPLQRKFYEDIQRLTTYLSTPQATCFMFRDFQARNIMLKNNELYFIDYQGGMRGAPQYDVASLLFQAKAKIPHEARQRLFDFYTQTLATHVPVPADFEQKYWGFVLLRILQVLGAYGYRGLYEKKPHFLTSIPFALHNLKWWLVHIDFPLQLPTLQAIFEQLTTDEFMSQFEPQNYPNAHKMTVRVASFSYRRGVPKDDGPHGGGFVFDCRSIHNPGRYTPYKTLTGRDQAVKDFLEKDGEITTFLEHVTALVDQTVDRYLARDFDALSVYFGCTGGQHRSVYSADFLAAHLQKKFGVKVELQHIEQTHKNWINT